MAARQSKMAWASSLALIGALLLGIGVITWFTAHWNEMGRLMKLALIFLALTCSHVAHGVCQTRVGLPRLARSMALLSVLYFRAALGLGASAETQQPLSIAVIGGMISSTLLTLVVVPSVYSLLEGRRERRAD